MSLDWTIVDTHTLHWVLRGRRRRSCLPETDWNILADTETVSSSRQSSLKMPRCSPIGHVLLYLVQNLSYEKWVWFTQRWACRWSLFSYQWFHTNNHFDTETKDNSKMAYSPYHLEDMVNEDDIDLLLHSSDIHGIPRLNESQHFDGHPRAVWLYDSISPPLQEFPPVKYNRANYYHSTNPRSNVV